MMRFGTLLALAVLPLVFASQAHAQASRTWVSGVGDDANPCSRTAPCKTFAGAISKTAAGGEIDALDPAGYGAVTITKAITIDGGGGQVASVLVSGTNAIVVSAGPSDVVILRNLSLNGLGTGLDAIRFLAGGALHVEHVTAFGFTGQGITFNPTGPSQLFVTNSTFRHNTGGGIYILPPGGSVSASVDGVTLEGNGRGLRAEDGATVVVRNSIATGNGANGFVALSASVSPRPISMAIENTVSSANGATGVYAGALATVRISNVTVTNNADGLIATGGGTLTSFGNNRVDGNAAHNGPANTVVPEI
jgi:hypothetical protein